MQITAKYAGTCKACGLPIHVGDKIDWERGNGAAHVTCPARENVKEKLERELEEVKARAFTMPIVEKNDDFIITVSYYQGEYLWGYRCNAPDVMEKLSLGKYVNGWGTEVNDDVVNAIGKEFTVAEAKKYAIEKLESTFKKEREKRIKVIESKLEKFEEAASTGNQVLLRQWSESCNDYREECDVDNITIHAMPDGTTRETRSHTW